MKVVKKEMRKFLCFGGQGVSGLGLGGDIVWSGVGRAYQNQLEAVARAMHCPR